MLAQVKDLSDKIQNVREPSIVNRQRTNVFVGQRFVQWSVFRMKG